MGDSASGWSSANLSFITPPTPSINNNARFAVYGDMGAGNRVRMLKQRSCALNSCATRPACAISRLRTTSQALCLLWCFLYSKRIERCNYCCTRSVSHAVSLGCHSPLGWYFLWYGVRIQLELCVVLYVRLIMSFSQRTVMSQNGINSFERYAIIPFVREWS